MAKAKKEQNVYDKATLVGAGVITRSSTPHYADITFYGLGLNSFNFYAGAYANDEIKKVKKDACAVIDELQRFVDSLDRLTVDKKDKDNG